MKIFYTLLLALLIVSCGPSQKDKSKIELAILGHNIEMGKITLQEKLNRIDEETKITTLYIQMGHNAEEAKKLARHNIDSINGLMPSMPLHYDVARDTALTYEKYMEYCNKNNLDYLGTLSTLKK